MGGCDWDKNRFSVCMGSTKIKVNLCHECINNKFHGGEEEICDACKNYNNFKQKGAMKSLCDTCIFKDLCQEVDTQVFECDDYRER